MEYSSRLIVGFVVFCHIAALIPLFFKGEEKLLHCPPRKIHLNTHILQETKQEPVAQESRAHKPTAQEPVVKKEAAPKKEAAQVPIKKPPAILEKKEPLVKAAPSPKSAERKKKELLAALTKIPSLEIPKCSPTKAIESLPTLSIESGASGENSSYQHALISHLQKVLILPEQGIVKVKLRLSSQGKAITSAILFSESSINAEYVKEKLPSLSFPCFYDQKERTITITLEGKISD